jgi:hypothetical protein
MVYFFEKEIYEAYEKRTILKYKYNIYTFIEEVANEEKIVEELKKLIGSFLSR